MGQKVSPVGLRIGINKDWESKWYANDKDFAKYLQNDNQIRKFLLKKYKDAASSRTRSESQRINRLQALLEFCNITTDHR